jgi:hypothetical protein
VIIRRLERFHRDWKRQRFLAVLSCQDAVRTMAFPVRLNVL